MNRARRFLCTIAAAALVPSGWGCKSRDAAGARAPVPVRVDPPGTTELLATIPDGARAPSIPAAAGLGLHAMAPSGALEVIFGERGGVAYAVERGDQVQVVHDGRPGKAYAAVGAVALSPDGRRCAHGALVGGTWRMVVDGVEGRSFDAVQSPVFSPDGAHVAYQAMAGERWYLVVDGTANRGTASRYLQHVFAAGSERIAYVDDVDENERGRLVVSDLAFRRPSAVATGVLSIHPNDSSSRVAAVVASGAQQVVLTVDLAAPERVERGPAFDAIHELAFGRDGVDVAYVAERAGKRFVVVKDREEPLAYGDLAGLPATRPGSPVVGALVASGGTVFLREFFGGGGPREGVYEEAEGLVYADGGRAHAYAARRGERWFAVVNGVEGPEFDRVVTPRFSADGARVVYRARKDGRRFVVVAPVGAGTVRQHPDHEQVFPVQLAPDGRSIAYGVKDGPQLAWRVEEF